MDINLVDSFQDDIISVIEKYRDSGIDVASIVGVLEVIKFDIISELGASNGL
jgi:septum formation topological specificity factor MinE